MSNIRELSQLASVIHVNDETRNVGIGTTEPEAKLSVGGNVVASGNVTADAFYGDGSNLQGVVSGVGIQSAGVSVGTGITTLNFIGAGNTFAINGNSVDISISGGGGASVSIGTEAPVLPSEGDLWYNSNLGRTFVYYNDGDSSQWVDAAPFNVGITTVDRATNVIGGIGSITSLNVSGNASISGTLSHTGTTANISNTTSANTTNVATGAVASAVQKTINVGTGGATGSRLLVDIGPTNLGASTVRFNSGTNVIIGAATTTGTASQPLQVTGGAYVSGSVGIGTTNPGATLNVVPTATSIAGLFSGTTSSDMVRITQLGSGNALVVEDSANPDSSPFVVKGDGSVGIGTNNPTVALQLSPNASISNVGSGITLPGTVGSALTVAQFLHVNTNTSYLRIKATRNTAGSDWYTASTKLLQVTDVTEQGYVEFNPSGSTYGMAFGQGGTEWARFLQSGNLGIGTTNPTSRLQVQGNVRVVGVITCTDIDSTSDINLKTNIKPIENSLEKILQINGVNFTWKETQQPSMGVIAQELEKVFPELVKQSDSHKSVNYNGLIGVLIEAIKEQQKQIEELKYLKEKN